MNVSWLMSADAVYALLEKVQDEAVFVRYVDALIEDRRAIEGQKIDEVGFRGEWANQSISQFLDAAARWVEDSEFGRATDVRPKNPWQAFALFLWAGRGYE